MKLLVGPKLYAVNAHREHEGKTSRIVRVSIRLFGETVEYP
jgi:hypothetical protein